MDSRWYSITVESHIVVRFMAIIWHTALFPTVQLFSHPRHLGVLSFPTTSQTSSQILITSWFSGCAILSKKFFSTTSKTSNNILVFLWTSTLSHGYATMLFYSSTTDPLRSQVLYIHLALLFHGSTNFSHLKFQLIIHLTRIFKPSTTTLQQALHLHHGHPGDS